MENPRVKRWIPLLLLAFAAAPPALYYLSVRSRPESEGDEANRQRTSAVAAPGGSPTRAARSGEPSNPATGSPPPGAEAAPAPLDHSNFGQLLLVSKIAALNEIKGLLQQKGGAAALEHLQKTLTTADPELPVRLKGVFMARLIPWIASEDPSAQAAAKELSRTLLTSTDEWVRFQTLGGLGGFPSTRPGMASKTDGTEFRFWFQVDKADTGELLPSEPEYRKGFQKILEDDPSFRSLIGRALTGDSSASVRTAAAAVLGQVASPESEQLLATALSSDPNLEVRMGSLESLAKLGSSQLSTRLIPLISDEEEGAVLRVAALKLIHRYGPPTAESESLMAMALNSESLEGARASVLGAVFDYQKVRPSPILAPLMLETFARSSGDERVLQVFVDRAVQDGRLEYLPVFQALQASSQDPDIQQLLSRGIRDLQGQDAYQARMQQIQDLTSSVRALWAEFQNSATPPARRRDLAVKINSMVSEVSALQIPK